MLRLVKSVALGAAVLTVGMAVWRDYGLVVTFKRAALAYLTTFFVAGGLGLVAVAGLQAHRPPEPEPDPEDDPKARRARRRARSSKPANTPAPTPEAPAPDAEPVGAPGDTP